MMKSVLILVGILQAVALSCYCAESTTTNPAPAQATSRMNYEQLLAALPKSLGGYQQQNIGVYQPMHDYNRLSRAYADGPKHLNVEVRDTGGFTKEFIQQNFYLSHKVGAKLGKWEVLLIEGNRGQMDQNANFGSVVKIAWHDRYEIEVGSKSENYETLQKLVFEVAARLK